MINEQVTTSKFLAAVGSTMANPQDPDREILYATEQEMKGFASATHTENRKGVSHELLEKIWRINNKTAKRTIRTTTQLNRQGANSKSSRNFGTNDRMLRYRRIKYYFSATLSLWRRSQQVQKVTPACKYLFQIKGMYLLLQWKASVNFLKPWKCFPSRWEYQRQSLPNIFRAIGKSLTLFIAAINTYPLSKTNICIHV